MSSYYEKSRRKRQKTIYAKSDIEGKKAAKDYNKQEDIERELENLLEEENYYLCEQELYYYFKSAWNYIATGELVDGWYIKAVADHVQACIEQELPNNDLIISIPPRHLKSSICGVAAPTWTWGPRDLPETKFLSFSYGSHLSTRDALMSRRVMQSNWYQKGWSDRFSFTGDQNAKTRYDNDHLGYRISSSIGGAATGEGYDILLVDDPINAIHSNSSAKIEEVIEWWSNAMPSRVNDPNTGRRIIIMQRLATNDLVGHITEKEKHGWCVLELPMEYTQRYWESPLGWSDPRTKEGELLSPGRFSEEKIAELKRDMGPYKYSAQYQQDPVPPEGGIIKSSWFRYWNIENFWDMIWQSWDLGMDDGETNDFSVGTVWGKIGADRFLLDMFRGQWDINMQAKKVIEASKKYPSTRTILIENKANGLALNKMLKDPGHIKMYGYKVPPIVLCDPRKMGGDKTARLQMCVSEFSSGAVYFPDKNRYPWVEIIEKELAGFPRYKTDDALDSVTQSLNWVAQFGGWSNQYQFPQTEREKYELIQAKKGNLVEATFGGRMTSRGVKEIFDYG